ncbi:hypothetical protein RSOL_213120 [Rhizoctonia solani AG-3 Rhs1AP]|uniref:MYND-type domain-containing protein n=2 Tax=Rhizoctonia solani AG-3 TaxID=1086053 RepID=A0A074RWR3_9AGAM|nr:hypothetical protein RSOL_213120 [Rhizoctonia solani AG-3 Rhs1AP]KEP49083.1 hypothetical protein V565_108560 [Rhizoctonia solani 123E]
MCWSRQRLTGTRLARTSLFSGGRNIMLTRSQQPHPLWGRQLDHYTHAYQLSAVRRKIHGTMPRLLASSAAKQIGSYSDQLNTRGSAKAAEQITIQTLETILTMAEDLDTYKNFLSPRLMDGCITLMQTIKVHGRISPFSYEYGYLCLRILLFSLGTYMLLKSDDLELAIQNMIKSPEIETPLIFSSHVARVVQVQSQRDAQGLDCDSILGWGLDNRPLISPEHAKALVEILWDDRANLLKALMSTYTPALSGLLFLLWRYIYLDATLASPPALDMDLVKRITEIHFRCMLVATSDQGGPLLGIGDELCELIGITPGEGIKMFPKSEDSQTIFEAYIKRLDPTDTRIYAPPNILLVTILLELLVSNMGPGLEPLLPSVFAVTTRRFWTALTGKEEVQTMLLGSTGMMLEHFKSLLQANSRTNVLSQSVQKDILESFANNDLIDLAAAALFRLDADADESSPAIDLNYNFLKSLQTTFDKIGASHTPALLEECFRGYATDWLKVQHQINIRGMCMELHNSRNEAGQRRKRHYERCNGVWDSIARMLRQKDNIERARKSWSGCMFLRCQDPIGIDRKGAPYACSKCKAMPYCSSRCQAGDWVIGGERDPHCTNCQQFSNVFNPTDLVASFASLMKLL